MRLQRCFEGSTLRDSTPYVSVNRWFFAAGSVEKCRAPIKAMPSQGRQEATEGANGGYAVNGGSR